MELENISVYVSVFPGRVESPDSEWKNKIQVTYFVTSPVNLLQAKLTTQSRQSVIDLFGLEDSLHILYSNCKHNLFPIEIFLLKIEY